jgi:hypothetical protein
LEIIKQWKNLTSKNPIKVGRGIVPSYKVRWHNIGRIIKKIRMLDSCGPYTTRL